MDNIKFTTKSMIIDGNRTRVRYSMDGDNLTVTGKTDDGKEFSITLDPSSPHYNLAKAAYDLKAEKRAAMESQPREVQEKMFAGMQLKGRNYVILMDDSIGRATITFKTVPSKAVREEVKAAGFYYSPNHKQWCRKLTNKAWKASQELHQKLSA